RSTARSRFSTTSEEFCMTATSAAGSAAPADIVVYDLNKLATRPMEIAHDFPGGDWRRVRQAEGYRQILVNGQTDAQLHSSTHLDHAADSSSAIIPVSNELTKSTRVSFRGEVKC